jgi:hypothetical protein
MDNVQNCDSYRKDLLLTLNDNWIKFQNEIKVSATEL